MLRAAQCTSLFPSSGRTDLQGAALGRSPMVAPMMPMSPSSWPTSPRMPIMHTATGIKQPGGVFPISMVSHGLHAALHRSMNQGFASSASPGGIDKDGVGKGDIGSGSGAGGATTVSSEGDQEPLRMSLQEAIMRLAEAAVGKVS